MLEWESYGPRTETGTRRDPCAHEGQSPDAPRHPARTVVQRDKLGPHMGYRNLASAVSLPELSQAARLGLFRDVRDLHDDAFGDVWSPDFRRTAKTDKLKQSVAEDSSPLTLG